MVNSVLHSNINEVQAMLNEFHDNVNQTAFNL